jgi:hypothetical protein
MLNEYAVAAPSEHWRAFEDDARSLVRSLRLSGALMDGSNIKQMWYIVKTDEATMLYLKIKHALTEDNISGATVEVSVELCRDTHLA